VALDLFKLFGVPAGVGVPNVGFIGYVASISGTKPQVLGKKSMTTVSSFADGDNMVVEGQFRVDVHTKKFSGACFLQ